MFTRETNTLHHTRTESICYTASEPTVDAVEDIVQSEERSTCSISACQVFHIEECGLHPYHLKLIRHVKA